MLARSLRAVLFFGVVAGLAFGLAKAGVQAQDTAIAARSSVAESGASASIGVAPLAAGVVYSQPPSATGGLLKSSRQVPQDTDADRDVWEAFTFPSAQAITEVQWRGGYDPAAQGSGGPVIDFEVAFYASIPAGTQPDVVNPPLVQYLTGGNAGQAAAGTFGGIPMYDYQFALPAPFQAAAGTKYWLRITALQQSLTDWGLSVGTGGDGSYFRRISLGGGSVYQTMNGDAAFSLLGPLAGPTHTPTSTVTPTVVTVATATPTSTPTATRTPAPVMNGLYLPQVSRGLSASGCR